MQVTKINLNAAIEKHIQETIEERKQLHLEYPEMADDDDFAIPSADKKYWKKTQGFEYRVLEVPCYHIELLRIIVGLVPKEDIHTCDDRGVACVSIWVPKNGRYEEEAAVLIAFSSIVPNAPDEPYSFELISLERDLLEIAEMYLRDSSKVPFNGGKVGKGWDNW